MNEWKDMTIYSQGDKERKVTTLEKKIGDMDIAIHTYIGCGYEIFLTSSYLDIHSRSLHTTSFDEAKTKALAVIRWHLIDGISRYNIHLDLLSLFWTKEGDEK